MQEETLNSRTDVAFSEEEGSGYLLLGQEMLKPVFSFAIDLLFKSFSNWINNCKENAAATQKCVIENGATLSFVIETCAKHSNLVFFISNNKHAQTMLGFFEELLSKTATCVKVLRGLYRLVDR